MENQTGKQIEIKTLRQFRRQMVDHFNLDELRTLCLDLNIDFEVLGGENKFSKARELILLHYRRNNLDGLLAAVQQTNPLIPWPSSHDLPQKIENGQAIWEEDDFFQGCLFQIGRYKMVLFLLVPILFVSGLFFYQDSRNNITVMPTNEAIAVILTPAPSLTNTPSKPQPTVTNTPSLPRPTATAPLATRTTVLATSTPSATTRVVSATLPPTQVPTATLVPPTSTFTPIPPSPELNALLDPNFGFTSLTTGFWPNSYAISMTSGGDVDVSYLNSGSGCAGYATAAPDFRLFWTGEGDELNFMFIADSSDDDTTLIINDPNGNWYCNDDFDGMNPGISFDTAVSGQYDIWIGSYWANDNVSGQLNISEPGSAPQIIPAPSTGINPSLEPNFGSKSLPSGFWPDPDEVSLTSGGDVDVSYLNIGYDCTGYTTTAPDFRLFWSGDGDELNFIFIPDFSGDDTTLIINDPDGNWHCNDDFDGLNPGIHFDTAMSGQYDIWIGSYSANDNISGQLNITEFAIP